MAQGESLFIQKRLEKFQHEAQKHRTKADEHNDGIFLTAIVVALVADLLGLLALFLGPMAFLLPVISGMLGIAINAFFWWYRRDVMQNLDHILMGVLSALEFMPLVSALPFLTITVGVRWWVSSQAAAHDREEAERNEKLAAKEYKKLMRTRRAENAALFIPPAEDIDTDDEDEEEEEAA